jgi:hypothetical protein
MNTAATTLHYHGIIIRQSQTDKSIFAGLKIIGKKRVLAGLITLYKVEAGQDSLDTLISSLQGNMATRLFLRKMEFYAHFYREEELVAAFKRKVFHMTPSLDSWGEAISYGKSIGIRPAQLDFKPCRVEDETY